MKVEFNGSSMRAEMGTNQPSDEGLTPNGMIKLIKESLSVILGVVSIASALSLLPIGMWLRFYFGMPLTQMVTLPIDHVIFTVIPCVLSIGCSVTCGVISLVIGSKTHNIQATIGRVLSIIGLSLCVVCFVLYLVMFICG